MQIVIVIEIVVVAVLKVQKWQMNVCGRSDVCYIYYNCIAGMVIVYSRQAGAAMRKAVLHNLSTDLACNLHQHGDLFLSQRMTVLPFSL